MAGNVSARLERAKAKGLERVYQDRLRRAFEPKRQEQVVVYAGGNEVLVDGVRYPFRDTQGVNPAVGQRMTARNVGRLSVAIYAPVEGTEL